MARLIVTLAIRAILGVALLTLLYLGLQRADAVDWQALAQPPRQAATIIATEAPIEITVVIVEEVTNTPPPTETAPTATMIVPPIEEPTATATEAAIPTETPTVEPTSSPTKEECNCLRKTQTESPKATATATASKAPTEEPSLTPTEECCLNATETPGIELTSTPVPPVQLAAVDLVWQVVRQNSSDPLEGAIVTLAFNGQPDAEGPTYWSDTAGRVHIYLESQPEMGPDEYGVVTARIEGYQVTNLLFKYDSDQRRLVFVSADEQSRLSEQHVIRMYKQANLPDGSSDRSKVVADCSTVECPQQILRTSGYVDPAATINCREDMFDNSRGSQQTFRASNGYSIGHMAFGPSKPLDGWRCSADEGSRSWFIIADCGNLIELYNPNEEE